MTRLLVVSSSTSLAERLSDVHDVRTHPTDRLTELNGPGGEEVIVLDVGDPQAVRRMVIDLRNRGRSAPVLALTGYHPGWATFTADELPGPVVAVPVPVTRTTVLAGIAELDGSSGDPVPEESGTPGSALAPAEPPPTGRAWAPASEAAAPVPVAAVSPEPPPPADPPARAAPPASPAPPAPVTPFALGSGPGAERVPDLPAPGPPTPWPGPRPDPDDAQDPPAEPLPTRTPGATAAGPPTPWPGSHPDPDDAQDPPAEPLPTRTPGAAMANNPLLAAAAQRTPAGKAGPQERETSPATQFSWWPENSGPAPTAGTGPTPPPDPDPDRTVTREPFTLPQRTPQTETAPRSETAPEPEPGPAPDRERTVTMEPFPQAVLDPEPAGPPPRFEPVPATPVPVEPVVPAVDRAAPSWPPRPAPPAPTTHEPAQGRDPAPAPIVGGAPAAAPQPHGPRRSDRVDSVLLPVYPDPLDRGPGGAAGPLADEIFPPSTRRSGDAPQPPAAARPQLSEPPPVPPPPGAPHVNGTLPVPDAAPQPRPAPAWPPAPAASGPWPPPPAPPPAPPPEPAAAWPPPPVPDPGFQDGPDAVAPVPPQVAAPQRPRDWLDNFRQVTPAEGVERPLPTADDEPAPLPVHDLTDDPAETIARRRALLGKGGSSSGHSALRRRLGGRRSSSLGPGGTSAELASLGSGHPVEDPRGTSVPPPPAPVPPAPAPVPPSAAPPLPVPPAVGEPRATARAAPPPVAAPTGTPAITPSAVPDHLLAGVPAWQLVKALSARSSELFGVEDTAQVLADDIVERASADAAAVLVPDGPVWRVSGGVGLRPMERRLVLDAEHWFVADIALAEQAILVEDSDVVRPRLAGAPLAAWRHLMAVPIPEARATVVLARGGNAGVFTDRELTAIVGPIREAAVLLTAAVATRNLARAMGPLREEPLTR